MRRFWIFLTAALLALGPVVASASIKQDMAKDLRAAKSVTLFSLEPEAPTPRDETGRCSGLCYFGWPVLGEIRVEGVARDAVLHELSGWISAPEPDAIAMCFNPRHGVRVETPQHTYDFIVCFECSQTEVYVDSSTKPTANLFKDSNQNKWNALLKAAGVQLASPASVDGI